MTTASYRHDTIPCEVLDEMARLPSDEQIVRVRGDIFAVYIDLMRKAKKHLEMRMEMLAEEERQQEQRR